MDDNELEMPADTFTIEQTASDEFTVWGGDGVAVATFDDLDDARFEFPEADEDLWDDGMSEDALVRSERQQMGITS